MKNVQFFILLFVVLGNISVGACSSDNNMSQEEQDNGDNESNLSLSYMKVKITSTGHTATFQLYETTAAEEFYNQLPLHLNLSNFRDAQWMFYPPQKLNVTENEAYHDGKRGDLSYYAPWGDVFMLYKDFYAGDEMHRIGINLTGINEIEKMSGYITIERDETNTQIKSSIMNIKIGNTILTATLVENSSTVALKEKLQNSPLTIQMRDYGDMEKVGSIGTTLPRNDEQITTEPGDLILYQGNSLVIYYKPNTWSFTKLGKINNVTRERLMEILGKGDVTVTLELTN